MINMKLAEELDLSKETIAEIEYCHGHRQSLGDESLTATDEEQKYIFEEWMDNERELQKLWGFEQDDRFIRFWYFPACSCPQMDNNDSYPSGYYVINGDCVIHGSTAKPFDQEYNS